MTPEQTLIAIETLTKYGTWTDEEVRGTQDSSGMTADRVYMTVRGGGIGGNAWLAHIADTDMRWGLEREFVDSDDSGLSKSGSSGTRYWDLQDDGIYEVRSFCTGSKHSESGFFLRLREQVAWIGEDRRTLVMQAIKAAKKATAVAESVIAA